MGLFERLQQEIDIYNDLVTQEHDAEKKLLEIREKRHTQFSKVGVAKELMETELKEASLAASSSGYEEESVKENAS